MNPQINSRENPANVIIDIDGKRYVLNEINGWVTLSKYAQLFNINGVNVLNNWIKRKIIPAEDIIEVPELNNLKLIRAVMYNTRPSGRPPQRVN